MCVVCFSRALAHVFRAYLAAQAASSLRGRPGAWGWADAGGGGRGALTCVAAAAGVWLLRGAALGEAEAGPGRPPRRARSQAQCLLRQAPALPGQLASCALAHALGRWLVHPGSALLTARALLPLLRQGQERLAQRYGGRRATLLARDGHEVDTVFVDRRPRPGGRGRGRRLVICCEGNAGFYETGCLAAPLEAGYSVLGWSRPGLGSPRPDAAASAMDAVVRHALQRLRFPPARVVLYGWSIGGFAATWAAMTYPELGALVLDAAFDDLVPLALKVMPRSWKGPVVRAVRERFSLRVAEQLCLYPGPVLLLRRARPAGGPGGHGGDALLLRLLRHRYPAVMARDGRRAVARWLRAGGRTPEAAGGARPDDGCLALLRAYARAPRGPAFPWLLGRGLSPPRRRRLALFLARQHLKDVDATACGPLAPEDFQLPWRLPPAPAPPPHAPPQ